MPCYSRIKVAQEKPKVFSSTAPCMAICKLKHMLGEIPTLALTASFLLNPT